jgi:hypothetical protein
MPERFFVAAHQGTLAKLPKPAQSAIISKFQRFSIHLVAIAP